MYRCNRNFISCVWSAVPVIKCIENGNIQYFDHPPRALEMDSADPRVPETAHRRSAMRVCWKKSLPP